MAKEIISLYHGTSETALPRIWREGFRGQAVYTPWTAKECLDWFKQMQEETQFLDDDYVYFDKLNSARIGTPLPGRIYCSKSVFHTYPRTGEKDKYHCALEVKVDINQEGIYPDEDLLGSMLGQFLLASDRERSRMGRTAQLARRLIRVLPDELLGVFYDLSLWGSPDAWEIGSPIGVNVIMELEKKQTGRRVLTAMAKESSSVSLPWSPKIVGLWVSPKEEAHNFKLLSEEEALAFVNEAEERHKGDELNLGASFALSDPLPKK